MASVGGPDGLASINKVIGGSGGAEIVMRACGGHTELNKIIAKVESARGLFINIMIEYHSPWC